MSTTGSNTIVSPSSRLTGQALAGLSVADVRRKYAELLNIPAGATVTINGHPVAETQTIVNGEEILFAKTTGQKGK